MSIPDLLQKCSALAYTLHVSLHVRGNGVPLLYHFIEKAPCFPHLCLGSLHRHFVLACLRHRWPVLHDAVHTTSNHLQSCLILFSFLSRSCVGSFGRLEILP